MEKEEKWRKKNEKFFGLKTKTIQQTLNPLKVNLPHVFVIVLYDKSVRQLLQTLPPQGAKRKEKRF